jgi:uncharacterized repeat protein (TIGR03803 family)
MKRQRFAQWVVRGSLLTVFLLSTLSAGAATETAFYKFSGPQGMVPYGAVAFDTSGNLYGTTYQGGAYGYGTVFQLSLDENGKWKHTILHDFDFGTDGVLPCAGVTIGASGVLYGTTHAGGEYGYGAVFQLTSGSKTNWTESVLYSFNRSDGLAPYSTLVMDGTQNLYGTTVYGGDYGYGVVFELSPGGNGTWNESVLHSFSGSPTDGAYPYGSLLFDAKGNLYGTTSTGGPDNLGTVFELTLQPDGTWSETLLYSFSGSPAGEGANPYGGLVFDGEGKLYGTTNAGGKYGDGTIFQLAPQNDGTWEQKILHNFNKNKDGASPYSGLVTASAKSGSATFYGTTFAGGSRGFGTVFQLNSAAGGTWTVKVLAGFNLTDGNGPYAGLTLDENGDLYGTTEYGGDMDCDAGLGCGVVFEITP